jgi:UDP-N-acetylglucosamine acyltransferase
MDDAVSCRIHPTAIISPDAELAADVRVGAFAIIEGKTVVGRGCEIRPRAHLIGPLTMGRDNTVFGNVVIGERPQHFQYKGEPTGVEIGDRNTFRENMTVHRGTTHSWKTCIGNDNYFMAGSHVAHDCRIGDRCILVNNALLGGHCVLEDGVTISGNSAIHQFCRMGRLSFLSGASGSSKDVPPFIIQQEINIVAGVNVVGMRRAGLNAEQISAIRRVYQIVYLRGLTLPNALAQVEQELGTIDVVQEFIAFVRASRRGINGTRRGALEPLAA